VTGGTFGTPTPLPVVWREDPCPCGHGTYGECCGAVHTGRRAAATAEELMRSRYSAFAVGDEDYLLRSWHPRTRPEQVHLAPGHRWTGLRIESTAGGGPDDETGEVTYVVSSLGVDRRPHELREHARFERRAGRWVYVDGAVD